MENSGELKTYEVTLNPLRESGDNYLGCILLIRDISEKIKAEEKIAYAASHDYLTGLPNRYFFMELFEKEISQSKRRKDSFAIVYVDLDGFKKVNDIFGHDVGDLFLQHVSSCLSSSIREGDFAARFGGDEFVILLTNITSKEDIEKVVERIYFKFKEGYELDGNDSEILLKKADEAMYMVKNTLGGNNWRFYS